MQGERLHPFYKLGMAAAAISLGITGCNGAAAPSPSLIREPTPLSSPPPDAFPTLGFTPTSTLTATPPLTPTPTPDIFATQQFQWRDIENAEWGDAFQLSNPTITRIVRGGKYYWVEVNIPGKKGFTAFQSDCVKTALEDSRYLGEQTSDGIWEPETSIDFMTGRVKYPKDVLGNLFEPLGIKTPFDDLDKITHNGKVYDCNVSTLDEEGKRSIREIFEILKPQLEKIYPRIKQVGRIFGQLLDLAEQKLESQLTPTP